MRFQLEVADRTRTVEVHRHPAGLRIVVDGKAWLVDAVHVGDHTWSLIVSEADSGRVRAADIVVVPQNGTGGLEVYIGGHRIPVTPAGTFGRRGRGGGAAGGAGPQRITAPMPGKVVRVLVRPGDEVAVRQGLVVVEAMKMENEIRAARAGRVREVFVSEGQSVEAGTALVIVE